MRIALCIEYDGSHYYGWQRQKEVDSVQARLESALSIVADHQIEVQCAGRTDAGVHGSGQVVHFDTSAHRELVAWTMGVNAHLPRSIAVRWAKIVTDDFHARFSATARRYCYIIYNHQFRPALLANGVSHYHTPLAEQLMHEAGQHLIGEHDFSSFRAAQCQSLSPYRCIQHLDVRRQGDYVIVDIKANAFVHHMVRNIVGSLILVGEQKQPTHWIADILNLKDRKCAGPTAKAAGLYLVEVDYSSRYELPQTPTCPFLGWI